MTLLMWVQIAGCLCLVAMGAVVPFLELPPHGGWTFADRIQRVLDFP